MHASLTIFEIGCACVVTTALPLKLAVHMRLLMTLWIWLGTPDYLPPFRIGCANVITTHPLRIGCVRMVILDSVLYFVRPFVVGSVTGYQIQYKK